MTIPERVREHCAGVAASARHVSIDLDAAAEIKPGLAPILDPELHYLDGSRDDVAAYMLTLDTINFGSGWFPTLQKRSGLSGYYTIARGLAERFRERGPWSPAELRAIDPAELAEVFGQEAGHELMDLYAEALRSLGAFLAGRTAIEVVDDLDELTIFADNVVPHVLRVDGVLVYDGPLAGYIERGELIPPGSVNEMEIRACAVHACVQMAERLGVPERTLDTWLWDRGREPRYKALPRHRSRTVYY